jgi:vacuolar-type H+-ATPase subunit I/STV1
LPPRRYPIAHALLTAHSIVRWLVLLGLLATAVAGITIVFRKETWVPGYARMVAITVGIIDLQVTLGVLVWIVSKGWELSPFLAYLHPVGMLAAAATAHVAAARARKHSWGMTAITAGLLATLAIVVLLIPRDAWS